MLGEARARRLSPWFQGLCPGCNNSSRPEFQRQLPSSQAGVTQQDTATILHTHLHLLQAQGGKGMLQEPSWALLKAPTRKSCCFCSWHHPCAPPAIIQISHWMTDGQHVHGEAELTSPKVKTQRVPWGDHRANWSKTWVLMLLNVHLPITSFDFSQAKLKVLPPWQIPHISGNAFNSTKMQLQLGLPHQSSFTSFLVKDLQSLLPMTVRLCSKQSSSTMLCFEGSPTHGMDDICKAIQGSVMVQILLWRLFLVFFFFLRTSLKFFSWYNRFFHLFNTAEEMEWNWLRCNGKVIS